MERARGFHFPAVRDCGRPDPTAHVSAASISTIVCDVADKVELVLSCVKGQEHSVKNIVVMETPSADLVSRGQQAGIHILSLQEMEVSRHSLDTPLFSSIPSSFLAFTFLLVYFSVFCCFLIITAYTAFFFSSSCLGCFVLNPTFY